MLDELDRLGIDVAKLAAAPVWALTGADAVTGLKAAHRMEQLVTALKARLVQHAVAKAVPGAHGHRTTTAWLRRVLLLDLGPARDLAGQAAALAAHPELEQAVLSSEVDMRQAAVIAAALDAIPEELRHVTPPGEEPIDPQPLVAKARAALLEDAGQAPAQVLRQNGERIIGRVAPEIADRVDEAALRRQEARAHAKRRLTLGQPADGVVHISGALTAEDAATVSAALHPLCKPISGDTRTPEQRRADALVDISKLALRTTELPTDGGEPPQVTVTVGYDPLAERLGIGDLDTGERVSAETARRMGCDARILPVVLGGKSQVLDVGRRCRLATGPLRAALAVRDRGCTFPHCDRPARWCDVHHARHWSDGGDTKLDNLLLLCGHHHRVLHDSRHGWQVRMTPDGLPEFLPPPWIDPAQQPQRNLYHPQTSSC